MDLSQSFTGLVLLVSAIHLAETVGSALFAAPIHIEESRSMRPVQLRDDWYLFFHCSDLIGKRNNRSDKSEKQSAIQEQPNIQKPRANTRPSRISASC